MFPITKVAVLIVNTAVLSRDHTRAEFHDCGVLPRSLRLSPSITAVLILITAIFSHDNHSAE
jgi:hypothetical protein